MQTLTMWSIKLYIFSWKPFMPILIHIIVLFSFHMFVLMYHDFYFLQTWQCVRWQWNSAVFSAPDDQMHIIYSIFSQKNVVGQENVEPIDVLLGIIVHSKKWFRGRSHPAPVARENLMLENTGTSTVLQPKDFIQLSKNRKMCR